MKEDCQHIAVVRVPVQGEDYHYCQCTKCKKVWKVSGALTEEEQK